MLGRSTPSTNLSAATASLYSSFPSLFLLLFSLSLNLSQHSNCKLIEFNFYINLG
uniref:Uncharacterized protein n=1 Tax=Rhizophora mucronata TaxID=61149 RepID=A0A2P2IR85_RHIMU